jgi:Subtilase family
MNAADVASHHLTYDPDAAAELRAELRSLADGALRERVIEHLVRTRGELADETGPSATRVAVERIAPDGGVPALVARGELLVAGPAGDAGVRLLERLGYEVLGRAGTVVRLRNRQASGPELVTTSRALVALGVTAGPNYVTSVAVVMKGLLGLAAARPTDVDPGIRPAGSPAGAGIRVGVIDTGIDPRAVGADHGWLAGTGVDAANEDLLDSVPAPDGYLDGGAGHGTFVAGLVRQAAPGCDVTVIRALDSDGVGTEFSVAEALFDLADTDDPPQVLNLSLACLATEELAPVAISAALDRLLERHPGTVVVAAAGNDGAATPTWPAAHKAVLAVGAADGDAPAAYSNRGWWVDFSVPADGVVSTYVRGTAAAADRPGAAPVVHDGDYAAWSGTSFAAPQVAGAIAVALAAGATPADAVTALRRRGSRGGETGWVLAEPGPAVDADR